METSLTEHPDPWIRYEAGTPSALRGAKGEAALAADVSRSRKAQ